MAQCIIDSGFALDCGGFALAGGLSKLYIANKADVASITKSSPTGKYDTITMVSGKVFYAFDFAKDSASFAQETEITEAGTALKQTVIFSIPNYDNAQATRIEQFSFAKVMVIAETRQGKRILLGDLGTSGLELEQISQNTGSAQTDANSTVYTLSTYVAGAAEEVDNATVIPV